MRKVVTTSAAVLFFSFVLEIAAQGQAPKPGPEQKKLEALLGSWTFEWDTKPSIFGPGGKVIERYQPKTMTVLRSPAGVFASRFI